MSRGETRESPSSETTSGTASSLSALRGAALIEAIKKMRHSVAPTMSSGAAVARRTVSGLRESVNQTATPVNLGKYWDGTDYLTLAQIEAQEIEKYGALPSPYIHATSVVSPVRDSSKKRLEREPSPLLVHIVPDGPNPDKKNAALCGISRWGRASVSPDSATLTVDLWCSRCLAKWEKANQRVATMMNGIPARSRVRIK